MKNSLHFCPVPATIRLGRSTRPGAPVLIAGILLALPIALPITAPCANAANSSANEGAAIPMSLRVGKSVSFPIASNASFRVEEGALNAICDVSDGSLNVRALGVGKMVFRVETPGKPLQRFVLNLTAQTATATPDFALSSGLPDWAPGRTASKTPLKTAVLNAPPQKAGFGSSHFDAVSSAPAPLVTRQISSQIVAGPGTPGVSSSDPLDVIPPIPSGAPAATTQPPSLFPPQDNGTTTPRAVPVVPNTQVPVLPTLNPPPEPVKIRPRPAVKTVPTVRIAPVPVKSVPVNPAPNPAITRISPVLPQPAKTTRAKVTYVTTPRLPRGFNAGGAKPAIAVSQGLARLLSFNDNILSVFFSDPTVMDARAINARTIAVTGIGAGNSTLAVFTSRYPGDAVGKANIYRISTAGRNATPVAPSNRDPQIVSVAVNAALGDPRIRASVFKLPDGSLATRLTGTVRNPAEVEGAITTASFYAPRVLSSLYADANAPSIDAVLNGSPAASVEPTLQDNLRRLTGNQSIELIPLPTGLGLKAEVNSTQEAEQLLRYLPSLNQQVLPFIVVRGAGNGANQVYDSQVPFLQGEDRQLTDKLQSVTGIRSVYAVRTALNAVAIYGTVQTRAEYQAVRRYAIIIGQISTAPGGGGGGPQLSPVASYDPAASYQRNPGVQLFVRILNPREATIRNVNVETSVVEISRTALKSLGLEYGSVNVIGETFQAGTAGNTTVVPGTGGNPNTTVFNPGTPGVINRTIDPTIQNGALTFANGFAGGGPTQLLSPLRARLNALAQNGDARILSRPTVRSVEGMSAQITIGGERPVPSGAITNGAATSSVEFRRFGVIISMRPTVTDDNTIILQIRADVTQPDRTYEINLNGALIPGEVVRSIDTTLTVRPGDTVIMGGLMTNEKRQQTTKVPILGDLPIIGALFKSKRFENNETELAIFMTPRIEAIPASEDTLQSLLAAPSFPALPSRQDSNNILFQDTTRRAQ